MEDEEVKDNVTDVYLNVYLTRADHEKSQAKELYKWVLSQMGAIEGFTVGTMSSKTFEQYLRVDIKCPSNEARKAATKKLDKQFRTMLVKSAFVRKGDLYKALGISKDTKQKGNKAK